MKDKKVIIPQDAMEETIQACVVELEHVYKKQNTSFMETLMRFLMMDLQYYMIAALLMFVVLLFIHIFVPETKSMPMTMYFGFLGCLHIYEVYKNKKYDMEELCTPVYLHKGRVFLYKNASLAMFEILSCFLFSAFSNLFLENQTLIILLSGFIPLLLCQIGMLFFLPYIHHMYSAIVVYVLLYVGFIFLYKLYEDVFLQSINIEFAYLLCVLLVVVFLLEAWYIYNRKGDNHGISNKAY